jgi:disulfide bond formation protein DsbB
MAEFVLTANCMQASASIEPVSAEAEIVGQLLAQNKHQHRRADYFQKLSLVHRAAARLERLATPQVLQELAEIMQVPLGRTTWQPLGMAIHMWNQICFFAAAFLCMYQLKH